MQEGLRTKALTLGEEEKKATTNMVSIRFGALQPVSIPVEEMDPLDTEVRADRSLIEMSFGPPT